MHKTSDIAPLSSSQHVAAQAGFEEFCLMKIGIDARSLINRRGIGTTVYHLLHELAELPDDYSCVLYVDNLEAKAHMPRDGRFKLKLLQPKAYPIWEQIILPLAAIHDRLDILHCPANTAPIRLTNRIKLILTIHDVMFLFPSSILPKSPSVYQRLGRLYYRWCVTPAARRANMIITISEVSRHDILEHQELNPDKIRVIQEAPNGSCRVVTDNALLSAVKEKYGLCKPFILALGAIDPRKNTARIIEAFSRFRQRIPIAHQLAIIGLPSGTQETFRALARKMQIASDVVLADFVPEGDLVALYNAAEMLVYPSLYEGFGLPVLEAMACGTPVITSRRGSIPEVAGDAAVMVDPLDVDEIATAMSRVTLDAVMRRDLVAKGKIQAGMFSWQRTAEKTFEIYENVMAGG